MTVTQAIYETGPGLEAQFEVTPGDLPGMAPTIYRPAAALAEIRFAIGACSLGSMLVARSEAASARFSWATTPTRRCATSASDFRARS